MVISLRENGYLPTAKWLFPLRGKLKVNFLAEARKFSILMKKSAGKLLKILKKLFSKSFLSGVWGNAPKLRFKQAAPRRLFGRSKISLFGRFYSFTPRDSVARHFYRDFVHPADACKNSAHTFARGRYLIILYITMMDLPPALPP